MADFRLMVELDESWKRFRGPNNARKASGLLLVLILGGLAPVFGQQTEATGGASSYEQLPELKASEILKPDYLKGPHYSVREPVPTGSGVNQFVIDSDFGVFDADGNEMLMRRVREIYAIARLDEISKTEQFKESLKAAAKAKYEAAKNIVTNPGTTIQNAPKGVMKFMGRAKESIKNIGKEKEGYNEQGSSVEKMTGQSKTKRQIAVSMGIDPYTTNAVLQKELDDVAWASWAGGFAFSAGTFPIGGAAGMALTAVDVGDSLNKVVQEKPPADLRQMNKTGLRNAGASERDAEMFLNSTAFTPTEQAAFVLNLKTLNGVANRAPFIRSAAEQSTNESDALFCVQTMALLSKVHTSEHPLARIVMINGFPVGIAKDGTMIVALQWDYAAWTAGAAAFVDDVQKGAAESGSHSSVMVMISGHMTPRLQQELKNRGFTVRDRVNPGPLL